MARFVQDVVLNKPDDFVQFIMNDYLQKQGFAMSDWKGEPAYRAGDGLVEGYKYLKWSYADGRLHLEAWIKGNFGKEWNLDGFTGCLMKKPYKDSLLQLFDVLQQPLPQNGQKVPPAGENQESASQGAENTSQAAPNVIPVQTVDNYKAAQAGLVFGILSIIVALLWPLIGIILGVIGFSRARMGGGSSKASQAKAGKICSIIGICLSAVIWVLNFVLSGASLLLQFL